MLHGSVGAPDAGVGGRALYRVRDPGDRVGYGCLKVRGTDDQHSRAADLDLVDRVEGPNADLANIRKPSVRDAPHDHDHPGS